MPVLPKSLFVLGASVQTARTARRLKQLDSAVPAQQATLKSLLPSYAKTEIGRDAGIVADMGYEPFRTRVPLRSYEQFSGAIDRMQRGETDVLWPGQCVFFAQSAGTTEEYQKSLPVTEEMLVHFRKASAASVMHYAARVGHSGVFRGRHVHLGGSTALTPMAEVRPYVAYSGEANAITALNLPAAVERYLYEPPAEIGHISDWTKRLEALVARTRSLDVTLVAGLPSWLLVFAEVLLRNLRGTSPQASLQHLWPNLECVMHTGVPLGPFNDELRRVVGASAQFHEVYSAAEGFIAVQDAEAGSGLRLLADAGLFYEFVPMEVFDPNLPQGLGSRAVPLEGVRIGADYAVVITTPSGLCRYVLGDIVRFISTRPARLVYVGRTKLLLDALDEHVIEKDLTDSLVAVCGRHNWSITNFHVAPLFINSLTGQKRGRHEWWVELRAGTVETPTGPFLAGKLDAELVARSRGYVAKRASGAMEPPIVRLVMPGFFEHWMRHHGKWGGQNKMPRSRSDRLIADELSGIACFTED